MAAGTIARMAPARNAKGGGRASRARQRDFAGGTRPAGIESRGRLGSPEIAEAELAKRAGLIPEDADAQERGGEEQRVAQGGGGHPVIPGADREHPGVADVEIAVDAIPGDVRELGQVRTQRRARADSVAIPLFPVLEGGGAPNRMLRYPVPDVHVGPKMDRGERRQVNPKGGKLPAAGPLEQPMPKSKRFAKSQEGPPARWDWAVPRRGSWRLRPSPPWPATVLEPRTRTLQPITGVSESPSSRPPPIAS